VVGSWWRCFSPGSALQRQNMWRSGDSAQWCRVPTSPRQGLHSHTRQPHGAVAAAWRSGVSEGTGRLSGCACVTSTRAPHWGAPRLDCAPPEQHDEAAGSRCSRALVLRSVSVTNESFAAARLRSGVRPRCGACPPRPALCGTLYRRCSPAAGTSSAHTGVPGCSAGRSGRADVPIGGSVRRNLQLEVGLQPSTTEACRQSRCQPTDTRRFEGLGAALRAPPGSSRLQWHSSASLSESSLNFQTYPNVQRSKLQVSVKD